MPTSSRLAWSGINALLLGAVLGSAVAVIETSHQCRSLYSQLQHMQSEQWGMQEDWGRLLLQHSAKLAHYRVDQLARKELGMRVPEASELRVITP